MEINSSVALYAAVLSTAIAIWEYIKWRNRHYLEVICNANMLFLPSTNKKKYIIAKVTNKGETPTTITHLVFYYWPNRLNRFLKRKRKSFVVNSDQVPKMLNPGEQWFGQVEQNDDIEKMALEGLLYAVVIHSMSKKEILRRIRISKKWTSSTK
jgi:hypothetical protein